MKPWYRPVEQKRSESNTDKAYGEFHIPVWTSEDRNVDESDECNKNEENA
jgi:hypothetical protein